MSDSPDFVCLRCGACCRAPGDVRLEAGEAEAIACAVGMTFARFLETCTRLSRDRRALSLIDGADGACLFLNPDNTCRIQAVKPRQCRDYPHRWRSASLDAVCAGRMPPYQVADACGWGTSRP